MPVDDLWYLKTKGPDGKRLPSKRHGRGKRWRVRWEDPETGAGRTQLFDRKPDADAHDANVHADISRGQYLDPAAGRVTVAEYAEQWRKQLVQRAGTQENVERQLRLHVVPVIGSMQMAQVRSAAIKGWIRSRLDLDKPLAASTIRTIYHQAIQPMFAQAAIDRVIGRTPCVGITLPELPHGVYDLPTADQVHALAQAVPERYRALVYLAAGCGWRSGELFGLEVDGVDFLRREVHVRHQLRELSRGEPFLGPPKSKTSRRTNELPTLAGDMLARHLELYPPQAVTVTDRTNPDRERQRTTKLVFTDHRRRPIRRGEWSKIWRAAVDEANLPQDTYSLRSLRHYFATVLIFAKANVKNVQLAMGHATPSITLDTYLGYWPDDQRDRTRNLVDAALGTSCTGSVPAAQG